MFTELILLFLQIFKSCDVSVLYLFITRVVYYILLIYVRLYHYVLVINVRLYHDVVLLNSGEAALQMLEAWIIKGLVQQQLLDYNNCHTRHHSTP